MISIMLETFPFPLSILYYIFSLWEEIILHFLRIRRFDAFGNVFLFKITMAFFATAMHTVFPPSALLIPRKKETDSMSVSSAFQKSLFDTLRQFFKLQKSLKNWLIERERHP